MSLGILILSAFAIMNIVAFAAMGIDKNKAKKNAFRLSEAFLFATAIFGGSIGSVAGMMTFRHKTKKLYFYLGIPMIALAQFLGLIALLCHSLGLL